MQDMVAGRFRLPWEDDVVHVDGRSCGFAPPTRRHAPGNRLDAVQAALQPPGAASR